MSGVDLTVLPLALVALVVGKCRGSLGKCVRRERGRERVCGFFFAMQAFVFGCDVSFVEIFFEGVVYGGVIRVVGVFVTWS